MSDLFGNHIVGFPMRRLNSLWYELQPLKMCFDCKKKAYISCAAYQPPSFSTECAVLSLFILNLKYQALSVAVQAVGVLHKDMFSCKAVHYKTKQW